MESISLDVGVNVYDLTIDQPFNTQALTINVTNASMVKVFLSGSTRFTILLKKAIHILMHDYRLQHISLVAFPDLKTVDRLECNHCSDVCLTQLVAVNEFLSTNKSQMEMNLPRLA